MVRCGRDRYAHGQTCKSGCGSAARQEQAVFHPNVDCGDFVIVINTDKIVVTGKKLEKKYKSHHTLYMGALKQVQYKKLMEEKSDEALYLAIKGMLPKNSLGRKMLKKVRIYKGAEHNHEAQQPEVLNLVKRYN